MKREGREEKEAQQGAMTEVVLTSKDSLKHFLCFYAIALRDFSFSEL